MEKKPKTNKASTSGVDQNLGDSFTVTPKTETTLQQMPLKELRTYRKSLTDEEERVSYWRRLVQFRVNLIKTQKEAGTITTRELVRSLGSTGSGSRRQKLLSMEPQSELPQLPGLDELWTSAINLSDEEGTNRLVEELTRVEKLLSQYRTALHACIDGATHELIVRYKNDPNLSLELFPEKVV